MPLGVDDEGFKIDKGKLSPLATVLTSECVSALAGASSAEEAGQKMGAAIKKYVEGVTALIETEAQEQASGGAAGAGGPGAP